MTYLITWVGILALSISLYPFVVIRKAKNKIRRRADHYQEWSMRFNDLVMVESILSIICSDFLLKQSCVWKLSPDDMLNHLYKGVCFNLGGDAIELESIASNIEGKFDVDITVLIMKDTSLYMLVAYILRENKVLDGS